MRLCTYAYYNVSTGNALVNAFDACYEVNELALFTISEIYNIVLRKFLINCGDVRFQFNFFNK